MSESVEDLVVQLEKLGYKVSPPRAKPKPEACHVCGAVHYSIFDYPGMYDLSDVDLDNTDTAEWLTEMRVTTNPGEEGNDEVVLYFCQEHDAEPINKIKELGFVSHNHGGTALLADMSCPGYIDMRACPVNPRTW